ncbi:hypothetical protein [Streptomyces sp. NPDC003032]
MARTPPAAKDARGARSSSAGRLIEINGTSTLAAAPMTPPPENSR